MMRSSRKARGAWRRQHQAARYQPWGVLKRPARSTTRTFFHDAHRLAALGVVIGRLDRDRVEERLLRDCGDRGGGTLGSWHDADLMQELGGRRSGRRSHHGGELLERGAPGPREGQRGEGSQRRGERGGFGRREVQRGQRRVGVEAVPAAGAGPGPNRHPGLLQGQQVALDGAGADLEVRGQRAGGHRAGGARPQLLH